MGSLLAATAATTAPAITAQVTLTVVAASSAAASSISGVLNNATTLSGALAATGLSFDTLVAQPAAVLAPPPAPPLPPPPSASSSDAASCSVSTVIDFTAAISNCTLNATASPCTGCLEALALPLIIAGVNATDSDAVHACFLAHALEMLSVGVPVIAVSHLVSGCSRASFVQVAPAPPPLYVPANSSENAGYYSGAGGASPSTPLLLISLLVAVLLAHAA